MGYTLITILGTGMFKPNLNGKGGYQETTYEFSDGFISKNTCLFMEALKEHNNPQVSKIIIVGTRTSSWYALTAFDSDLWWKIYEEVDNKNVRGGIQRDTIEELGKELNKDPKIGYELHVHAATFEPKTQEDIFNVYYKDVFLALSKQKGQKHLIIDITHGYRYLPVLMLQMLQLTESLLNIEDLRIVYGEYNAEEGKAYARDLTSFWQLYEANRDLQAFKKSFEGIGLARAIKNGSDKNKKLEDWIRSFSGVVKSNYCLLIGNAVNALKEIDLVEYGKQGAWQKELADFLKEEILDKIDTSKPLSRQIFAYSKVLNKRNLQIQAFIALKVTLEVFMAEKDNPEKNIGNYEYTKKGWEKLRKSHKDKEEELENLRSFRNQCAHGGDEKIRGNKFAPVLFSGGEYGYKSNYDKSQQVVAAIIGAK